MVRAQLTAARRAGYTPQAALLVDLDSDEGAVRSVGISARAGCLGIPTENTHGFEMIHADGVAACAATLAYLLAPDAQ